MEHEGSLLQCSQKPATGPYPEPDESSSALTHNYFKILFNSQNFHSLRHYSYGTHEIFCLLFCRHWSLLSNDC
jgi:hypothetical protein